jgi:ubiquinone/menaquinone biosynthesis C-methylase UbiE
VITVDFNRIPLMPGSHILDIGCGSGRHTCEAYRLPEAVVVGADLNFEDILEARGRLQFHDQVAEHGGGSWQLNMADIRGLPYRSQVFDLVICSEVMEHILDEKPAVMELARVLKPGKYLALSVPRYLPERICWLLSHEYHQVNQGHVRIYRREEIVSLLERAGFTLQGVHHYAHGLHAPYWWLKCAVGPTRDQHPLVQAYHRFLTWDIMKKPRLTRLLDRLLNPLIGKSLVLYFKLMV